MLHFLNALLLFFVKSISVFIIDFVEFSRRCLVIFSRTLIHLGLRLRVITILSMNERHHHKESGDQGKDRESHHTPHWICFLMMMSSMSL